MVSSVAARHDVGACKKVVTQRLKRSGMRWSAEGMQAILTPRGYAQR